MEARIREMLVNWAKCKDIVPADNSGLDPLYSVKLEFLICGDESLGNRTYQEWSKDVVSRIEVRDDYSDHYLNSSECLTWSVETIVLEHLCIDVSDIKTGHLTALKAVWHAIESLTTFSSEDILEALSSKSINDNKPSHQQIRKSVRLIEKLYLLAMKGSIEGDTSPLLNLCDATFTTLLHAKQVSTAMAKGAGPRKASLIKNAKNILTRDYAISLYDRKNEGKEWKSMRDAARIIHTQVMEHAKSVGCHFTNDVAQQRGRIERWIQQRPKKNIE
jgi:hypothetical protein